MLGLNYGPAADPLAALLRPGAGAISVYARNRDYHDVLKGKLKALASFIVAAARPDEADVKVFVDTAPLMEKPIAERAGIGWQGKHTNLVSREFGSWLFLGAILTDLEFDPAQLDPPPRPRPRLDDERWFRRHGPDHGRHEKSRRFRLLHGTCQPPPGEQLLRRQRVTAGDGADRSAVGMALRNDRRLLLGRPDPPPARAGEHLDPADRLRHGHRL